MYLAFFLCTAIALTGFLVLAALADYWDEVTRTYYRALARFAGWAMTQCDRAHDALVRANGDTYDGLTRRGRALVGALYALGDRLSAIVARSYDRTLA